MDLITAAVDGFAQLGGRTCRREDLKPLGGGVIKGVGDVIVFLPQILLNVFFISISRRKGLHGATQRFS